MRSEQTKYTGLRAARVVTHVHGFSNPTPPSPTPTAPGGGGEPVPVIGVAFVRPRLGHAPQLGRRTSCGGSPSRPAPRPACHPRVRNREGKYKNAKRQDRARQTSTCTCTVFDDTPITPTDPKRVGYIAAPSGGGMCMSPLFSPTLFLLISIEQGFVDTCVWRFISHRQFLLLQHFFRLRRIINI